MYIRRSSDTNMAANNVPSCSILIATTDEVLLSRLSAALKQARFRLVHAIDGYETVRFCREQEEIGIMILDTGLPGLNGYEATRLIRESGNFGIIIILLAWFSVQALEMAYAVGCNELVAKPVNEEELVEMVMKLQNIEVTK